MPGPDAFTPSEKAVLGMAKRARWPHALVRGDGALIRGFPGSAYWHSRLPAMAPRLDGKGLAVRWPKGARGAVFPFSGGRWLLVGPFTGKKGPDAQFLAFASGLVAENLSVTDELQRKSQALEAVLHLGDKFASIKDLEELVSSSMVSEVVQLLNADRGTVYLLEKEGTELVSLIALGTGVQEIRLPVGRGIAGWVAQTGKILNIPDAYQDSRFNPAFDKQTGYHTKSVLATPMTDAQGHRIGVIQVINKRDGSAFTRQDEEFLRTLSAEAATAIINVRLVEEQRTLAVSMVTSLAAALDARDTYTAGHSHRVALYAQGIARYLGIRRPELDRVRMAGLMHDLGKIGVPDAILKKAGNLTPEEYETIKKHAGYTRSILREIRMPEELSGMPEEAGGHHERMDGSGYPDRLPGERIPRIARILAVADVFDAITSKRTYRSAMQISEALDVLQKGRGRHFAPDCVDAFMRYFDAELRPRWPKEGGGDVIIPSPRPVQG